MLSLQDTKPFEINDFAEQVTCFLLDGLDAVHECKTMKKYSKHPITCNEVEIMCDEAIAAFVGLAKDADLLPASYSDLHPIHNQAIEEATQRIMEGK